MKRKLISLVTAIGVGLGFMGLSGQAQAATFVHDYGIGKYEPGGNDTLLPDGVVISDQSSERFHDSFDLSGIIGTITGFELTLEFSGAGPSCIFGWCGLGEQWDVRIQGSDPSGTSDDLFVTLYDAQSPQTIMIDASSDSLFRDVFAHSVQSQTFEFWLAEESAGKDEFILNSAALTVNSDVSAIPLPASALLLLSAFGGLGALSISRKRTAQAA